MQREPVLTIDELRRFVDDEFPQIADLCAIDAIGPMCGRFRLTPTEARLRPGGTVSGPTMFELADCAFYLTLIAMIGREPLAVTTSAAIDFMRKPGPEADLVAEVRILKLGKLLATGDVLMASDGSDGPAARASMTYAIPPRRG